MSDLISREAAIEAINGVMADYIPLIWRFEELPLRVAGEIAKLPSAQQWIPFKTRPLTEDEKVEHPEWSFIIDGGIPDEGQRILVNVAHKGNEAVQMDEWGCDGEGDYLDSGYDIGTEVTAWMPLPTPYQGGDE